MGAFEEAKVESIEREIIRGDWIGMVSSLGSVHVIFDYFIWFSCFLAFFRYILLHKFSFND